MRTKTLTPYRDPMEMCPNCTLWWLIDVDFSENADLPQRMREWCDTCTSVYRREMSMRGMTGNGE